MASARGDRLPDALGREVVRMGGGDPDVEELTRLGGAVEVRDLVRPRAALDAALAARPLDQDLDDAAHLGGVALERDPLLQRDQALEPFLHDLLRHLVGEGRGPRAGTRG